MTTGAHRSASGTAPAHGLASSSNSGTAPTHGLASSSPPRALATRYLAIARAGNRRLQADLDPLEKRDRSRLAAARADLSDAAATERLFDRRLLQIAFPAKLEQVARTLERVNQARASLAATAAKSTSVGELHSYEQQLDAANRPVERAVKMIRRRLGLPPPPTS